MKLPRLSGSKLPDPASEECLVASVVSMLELVERATSASVFRSSGSNVRRDFAGRPTHARFRVRMMDDTGRSEREPAGRAEAMILRYTGLDPDGVAKTEVDHFGNCPVCGGYIDMRDLAQMLAHIQDAEIEISDGPEPPPRQ